MREIRPSDYPVIAEMMTAYFHEAQPTVPLSNRDKFVLDPDFVLRWAKNVVGNCNIFGFIDDNGMILGEISNTWVGPNKVANGGIWYVRPMARSGTLAWRLLKAFDDKAHKVALVARMALDNPSNGPIIDRMYKKIGFREYSKIYVKEY